MNRANDRNRKVILTDFTKKTMGQHTSPSLTNFSENSSPNRIAETANELERPFNVRHYPQSRDFIPLTLINFQQQDTFDEDLLAAGDEGLQPKNITQDTNDSYRLRAN